MCTCHAAVLCRFYTCLVNEVRHANAGDLAAISKSWRRAHMPPNRPSQPTANAVTMRMSPHDTQRMVLLLQIGLRAFVDIALPLRVRVSYTWWVYGARVTAVKYSKSTSYCLYPVNNQRSTKMRWNHSVLSAGEPETRNYCSSCAIERAIDP